MTYTFPLLRFIISIALLICLPVLAAAQGGMIDVTKFGAVGDGDPKKALQNTEAIKKAWNQAAKEDGTGGTLYFPAGTYVVNRIGAIKDGFSPLKYTNIKGDGQVKSILKLAPGQNSQLLRIPDAFFDATISDIGFNGNGDNNPETDHLVHVACYNCEIRNIYISRSGGNGLHIYNGQQIRVAQIDVEHNKGWGIVSENAGSITFDSVSSEYNKIGGLLIMSDAGKKWRSTGPGIIVSACYFEREPVGLELRGVSGVEVHATFASPASTAIKISKDSISGLGSTGNIIYSQGSTGDIEIGEGNYGNSIIVGPYTKSVLTIRDYDGRNYIGPLVKASSEIGLKDSIDMVSVLKNQDMAQWKVKSGGKSSWKEVKHKRKSSFANTVCDENKSFYELTTTADEKASISYTIDTHLDPDSTYYFQSLLDIYGSCNVELELYDTQHKQYYNWGQEKWTDQKKVAAVLMETRMPVLTNGTLHVHQFVVRTDSQPRQPRITYYIENCFGRKARFYCSDIRK